MSSNRNKHTKSLSIRENPNFPKSITQIPSDNPVSQPKTDILDGNQKVQFKKRPEIRVIEKNSNISQVSYEQMQEVSPKPLNFSNQVQDQDSLNQDIIRLKIQNENFSNQNKYLNFYQSQLQKENFDLKQQLQSQIEYNLTLQSEIQKPRKLSQDLIDQDTYLQLEKLKQQLFEADNSLKNFKQEIKTLNNKNLDLQKEYHQIEFEKSQIQNDVQFFQKQIEYLNNQLSEKDKKITNLEKKIDNILKQNEDLLNDLDQINQKNKSQYQIDNIKIESNLKQEQKDNFELRNQIESLSNQIQAKNLSLDQANEKLKFQEKEFKYNKSNQIQIEQIQSQMSKIEKEKNDCLLSSEMQIQENYQKIQELQDFIKDMEKQHSDYILNLENSHEDQINTLNQDSQKQLQKNNRLRRTLGASLNESANCLQILNNQQTQDQYLQGNQIYQDLYTQIHLCKRYLIEKDLIIENIENQLKYDKQINQNLQIDSSNSKAQYKDRDMKRNSIQEHNDNQNSEDYEDYSIQELQNEYPQPYQQISIEQLKNKELRFNLSSTKLELQDTQFALNKIQDQILNSSENLNIRNDFIISQIYDKFLIEKINKLEIQNKNYLQNMNTSQDIQMLQNNQDTNQIIDSLNEEMILKELTIESKNDEINQLQDLLANYMSKKVQERISITKNAPERESLLIRRKSSEDELQNQRLSDVRVTFSHKGSFYHRDSDFNERNSSYEKNEMDSQDQQKNVTQKKSKQIKPLSVKQTDLEKANIQLQKYNIKIQSLMEESNKLRHQLASKCNESNKQKELLKKIQKRKSDLYEIKEVEEIQSQFSSNERKYNSNDIKYHSNEKQCAINQQEVQKGQKENRNLQKGQRKSMIQDSIENNENFSLYNQNLFKKRLSQQIESHYGNNIDISFQNRNIQLLNEKLKDITKKYNDLKETQLQKFQSKDEIQKKIQNEIEFDDKLKQFKKLSLVQIDPIENIQDMNLDNIELDELKAIYKKCKLSNHNYDIENEYLREIIVENILKTDENIQPNEFQEYLTVKISQNQDDYILIDGIQLNKYLKALINNYNNMKQITIVPINIKKNFIKPVELDETYNETFIDFRNSINKLQAQNIELKNNLTGQIQKTQLLQDQIGENFKKQNIKSQNDDEKTQIQDLLYQSQQKIVEKELIIRKLNDQISNLKQKVYKIDDQQNQNQSQFHSVKNCFLQDNIKILEIDNELLRNDLSKAIVDLFDYKNTLFNLQDQLLVSNDQDSKNAQQEILINQKINDLRVNISHYQNVNKELQEKLDLSTSNQESQQSFLINKQSNFGKVNQQIQVQGLIQENQDLKEHIAELLLNQCKQISQNKEQQNTKFSLQNQEKQLKIYSNQSLKTTQVKIDQSQIFRQNNVQCNERADDLIKARKYINNLIQNAYDKLKQNRSQDKLQSQICLMRDVQKRLVNLKNQIDYQYDSELKIKLIYSMQQLPLFYDDLLNMRRNILQNFQRENQQSKIDKLLFVETSKQQEENLQQSSQSNEIIQQIDLIQNIFSKMLSDKNNIESQEYSKYQQVDIQKKLQEQKQFIAQFQQIDNFQKTTEIELSQEKLYIIKIQIQNQISQLDNYINQQAKGYKVEQNQEMYVSDNRTNIMNKKQNLLQNIDKILKYQDFLLSIKKSFDEYVTYLGDKLQIEQYRDIQQIDSEDLLPKIQEISIMSDQQKNDIHSLIAQKETFIQKLDKNDLLNNSQYLDEVIQEIKRQIETQIDQKKQYKDSTQSVKKTEVYINQQTPRKDYTQSKFIQSILKNIEKSIQRLNTMIDQLSIQNDQNSKMIDQIEKDSTSKIENLLKKTNQDNFGQQDEYNYICNKSLKEQQKPDFSFRNDINSSENISNLVTKKNASKSNDKNHMDMIIRNIKQLCKDDQLSRILVKPQQQEVSFIYSDGTIQTIKSQNSKQPILEQCAYISDIDLANKMILKLQLSLSYLQQDNNVLRDQSLKNILQQQGKRLSFYQQASFLNDNDIDQNDFQDRSYSRILSNSIQNQNYARQSTIRKSIIEMDKKNQNNYRNSNFMVDYQDIFEQSQQQNQTKIQNLQTQNFFRKQIEQSINEQNYHKQLREAKNKLALSQEALTQTISQDSQVSALKAFLKDEQIKNKRYEIINQTLESEKSRLINDLSNCIHYQLPEQVQEIKFNLLADAQIQVNYLTSENDKLRQMLAEEICNSDEKIQDFYQQNFVNKDLTVEEANQKIAIQQQIIEKYREKIRMIKQVTVDSKMLCNDQILRLQQQDQLNQVEKEIYQEYELIKLRKYINDKQNDYEKLEAWFQQYMNDNRKQLGDDNHLNALQFQNDKYRQILVQKNMDIQLLQKINDEQMNEQWLNKQESKSIKSNGDENLLNNFKLQEKIKVLNQNNQILMDELSKTTVDLFDYKNTLFNLQDQLLVSNDQDSKNAQQEILINQKINDLRVNISHYQNVNKELQEKLDLSTSNQESQQSFLINKQSNFGKVNQQIQVQGLIQENQDLKEHIAELLLNQQLQNDQINPNQRKSTSRFYDPNQRKSTSNFYNPNQIDQDENQIQLRQKQDQQTSFNLIENPIQLENDHQSQISSNLTDFSKKFDYTIDNRESDKNQINQKQSQEQEQSQNQQEKNQFMKKRQTEPSQRNIESNLQVSFSQDSKDHEAKIIDSFNRNNFMEQSDDRMSKNKFDRISQIQVRTKDMSVDFKTENGTVQSIRKRDTPLPLKIQTSFIQDINQANKKIIELQMTNNSIKQDNEIIRDELAKVIFDNQQMLNKSAYIQNNLFSIDESLDECDDSETKRQNINSNWLQSISQTSRPSNINKDYIIDYSMRLSLNKVYNQLLPNEINDQELSNSYILIDNDINNNKLQKSRQKQILQNRQSFLNQFRQVNRVSMIPDVSNLSQDEQQSWILQNTQLLSDKVINLQNQLTRKHKSMISNPTLVVSEKILKHQVEDLLKLNQEKVFFIESLKKENLQLIRQLSVKNVSQEEDVKISGNFTRKSLINNDKIQLDTDNDQQVKLQEKQIIIQNLNIENESLREQLSKLVLFSIKYDEDKNQSCKDENHLTIIKQLKKDSYKKSESFDEVQKEIDRLNRKIFYLEKLERKSLQLENLQKYYRISKQNIQDIERQQNLMKDLDVGTQQGIDQQEQEKPILRDQSIDQKVVYRRSSLQTNQVQDAINQNKIHQQNYKNKSIDSTEINVLQPEKRLSVVQSENLWLEIRNLEGMNKNLNDKYQILLKEKESILNQNRSLQNKFQEEKQQMVKKGEKFSSENELLRQSLDNYKNELENLHHMLKQNQQISQKRQYGSSEEQEKKDQFLDKILDEQKQFKLLHDKQKKIDNQMSEIRQLRSENDLAQLQISKLNDKITKQQFSKFKYDFCQQFDSLQIQRSESTLQNINEQQIQRAQPRVSRHSHVKVPDLLQIQQSNQIQNLIKDLDKKIDNLELQNNKLNDQLSRYQDQIMKQKNHEIQRQSSQQNLYTISDINGTNKNQINNNNFQSDLSSNQLIQKPKVQGHAIDIDLVNREKGSQNDILSRKNYHQGQQDPQKRSLSEITQVQSYINNSNKRPHVQDQEVKFQKNQLPLNSSQKNIQDQDIQNLQVNINDNYIENIGQKPRISMEQVEMRQPQLQQSQSAHDLNQVLNSTKSKEKIYIYQESHQSKMHLKSEQIKEVEEQRLWDHQNWINQLKNNYEDILKQNALLHQKYDQLQEDHHKLVNEKTIQELDLQNHNRQITHMKDFQNNIASKEEQNQKRVINLLRELEKANDMLNRVLTENNQLKNQIQQLIESAEKQIEIDILENLQQKIISQSGNEKIQLIKELESLKSKCDSIQSERDRQLKDSEFNYHKLRNEFIDNNSKDVNKRIIIEKQAIENENEFLKKQNINLINLSKRLQNQLQKLENQKNFRHENTLHYFNVSNQQEPLLIQDQKKLSSLSVKYQNQDDQLSEIHQVYKQQVRNLKEKYNQIIQQIQTSRDDGQNKQVQNLNEQLKDIRIYTTQIEENKRDEFNRLQDKYQQLKTSNIHSADQILKHENELLCSRIVQQEKKIEYLLKSIDSLNQLHNQPEQQNNSQSLTSQSNNLSKVDILGQH